RKSRVFTTVADQTRSEVHVLQGESDMAAYNKSLAKFELAGLPFSAKGTRRIEVSFEVDINGIISAGATDLDSRRSESITIHPSGGLSQPEVSRLVTEARAREAAERSKKDQEAVIRQLDGLVANTMRSVQAVESKLTLDEQQRIVAALERARKAKRDGSLDEL